MKKSSFLWGYALVFLIFGACKKNTPKPASAGSSKPIKSLSVTYPTGVDTSQIYDTYTYTFTSDSINNSFGYYLVDSSLYKVNGVYTLTYIHKTYYLTAAVPRRVAKISYRLITGADAVVPNTFSVSYDILFDYDDYTTDPNHLTVLNYSDTTATNITSEYTGAVGKYEDDYYISGNTLDILNCVWYNATRMPLKALSWNDPTGNYINSAYSDTSFEVTESDPFYYNVFFSGYPPYANVATPAFDYTYVSSAAGQYRTFAVDLLSDLNNNSNTILYGQRKLDFDYGSGSADNAVVNLFGLLYDPKSLYWEKVAEQSTALTAYASQGIFEFTDTYFSDIYAYSQDVCSSYTDSLFTLDADTYFSDIYAYSQDVCSSYTDSLFTLDGQGNKVLYGADRFTNKVQKDAGGNILSVTKSDAANYIFRSIKVGY
jgi:hypothetical protein